MKNISIMLLANSLLIFCSCVKDIFEQRNVPLHFKNNSQYSVVIFFNDDQDNKAIYPDTIISNFIGGLNKLVRPMKSEILIESKATWKNIFETSVPNDTMSIFVIDSDTLTNQPWDTIRSRYLILQRYDLSLKDLENRNFEIEYPYSPSRGVLKVWRP